MDTRDRVRLPPIFDNLDVGITFHHSETGAILDVNEPIERLYGYAAAELRATTVGEFTPPSTKFSEERAVGLIAAAAAGDSQAFEWQIERSNGELRWLRVHLNATTVDGVDGVVAEVNDITEYRARERRLRLLSRIVRHNLRNKMNVLLGYADRIRSAVEDESLRAELETVVEITNEVGTLSDSVRQIEEIAEPDATERSPTDLRDVVEAAVERARREYDDATVRLDNAASVTVVADEGVTYAVEHAIENAVEHNDRRAPEVTVTVVEDRANQRGIIRVADDGPPIPAVEIDVLETDVEASSTYHGSGVGLWVMQWCVDSLGGELSFAENTPRGNLVSIALPTVGPADQ
jgi:PAS domain S-box-containing protein